MRLIWRGCLFGCLIRLDDVMLVLVYGMRWTRLNVLPVSYIRTYFLQHEQAVTKSQGRRYRIQDKGRKTTSLRLCVCFFCGYRDLDEQIDELS